MFTFSSIEILSIGLVRLFQPSRHAVKDYIKVSATRNDDVVFDAGGGDNCQTQLMKRYHVARPLYHVTSRPLLDSTVPLLFKSSPFIFCRFQGVLLSRVTVSTIR